MQHHKTTITPVTVVGSLLSALCFYIAGEQAARAFLAGYILFSVDVILMAYIGHLIIQVIVKKTPENKKMKNKILILGLIKLVFVFGSLYLCITELHLPESYLFAGCLVSLIWVIGILCFEYSKHLKTNLPNIPCYQV